MIKQNVIFAMFNISTKKIANRRTSRIKVMAALVGRLSLSIVWENGPERGMKTVSFKPNFL